MQGGLNDLPSVALSDGERLLLRSLKPVGDHKYIRLILSILIQGEL